MKSHKEMLETACREFEADLVLYYYGDGVETERKRVEEHLHGCLRCRRFVDDLRRWLPQITQPKELPRTFWADYYEEMMEKINAHQEKKLWWRQLLTPGRLWMVPAVGTVAAAIFALVLVLGKGGSPVTPDQPMEKIPKEVMADVNQLEFFKSMDMLESLRFLESLDRTKAEPKTI